VDPGTYYLSVKAVADGVLTDPSEVVSVIVAAPEGLEQTEGESTVRKAVENGQLVIIRDGVRYSALGTVIVRE
jgi:hypothetical protein